MEVKVRRQIVLFVVLETVIVGYLVMEESQFTVRTLRVLKLVRSVVLRIEQLIFNRWFY